MLVPLFDAVTPYIDFLVKLFKGVGKGKHVVVDGGNGVAGPVYCDVLKRIGCKVTELYTEPDGEFPNHPADPSKHATLRELQEKVRELNADCGFGFDGDGDRVGLVDEKGAIVTADQVLLLLAQDHLSRHKGAPVIFTVSNSSLLETEVKKWGGTPVMCKVGHSFVEHAMRDNNSKLGGEQSGHFFCGEEYFSFDDALVAAVRCLKIVSDTKKPLSSLVESFPVVFQAHERRPHCPDDKKAAIVDAITKHLQEKYPVVTLDGARVDFGDGAWAGIRYSNTSPCLSLCIEARSEKKLQEVEAEVLNIVGTFKEVEL
jgi:phosphomannomutase/phosphoglucomutase